jgi:ERCC4-type nuclease
MRPPVTILVDRGEQRSGVPQLLESAGARLELASLGVADYVVADGVGVERKTTRDLGRSILTGRLWNQVAKLRTLRRPYLLIEGPAIASPGVTRLGVKGALLQVLDNGIVVLWSRDIQDTTEWLMQLAARTRRTTESPMRRRRASRVTTSVGLVSAVPGITPATAQRLLDTFGSVAGISTATMDELLRIRGLGPKRAAHLQRILSPRKPL